MRTEKLIPLKLNILGLFVFCFKLLMSHSLKETFVFPGSTWQKPPPIPQKSLIQHIPTAVTASLREGKDLSTYATKGKTRSMFDIFSADSPIQPFQICTTYTVV